MAQSRTLRSVLQGTRPEITWVIECAIGMCDALEQFGQQIGPHGTLNPNTVLLDDSGKVKFAPPQPAMTWTTGTLPYLAPERTGRMNRPVDTRADIYAIGVMLYEMLAEYPPFSGDDALAIVHSTLARTPAPLELGASLQPLAQVTAKLLAKDAAHRYQTAQGLRVDLQICLDAWSRQQKIDEFHLAARDTPPRFLVATEFCGRRHELDNLANALHLASAGVQQTVVVSGLPGIGKTTLIRQLEPRVTQYNGYMAVGKCGQLGQTSPYQALVDSLQNLFQQLLCEGPERIQYWRASFLEALGDQAGVLAEIAPSCESIIGKQLPPPRLDPGESQSRLESVLGGLLGMLAGAEHPFVLFLDDLQWADAGTLQLLRPIHLRSDAHRLLLILSYRSNEVADSHPLAEALRDLERIRPTSSLRLEGMHQEDLAALVVNILHQESEEPPDLAAVLHAKTGGNPFFVIQLLRALHDNGLITFDPESRRWVYSAEQVASVPVADNVVQLLENSIDRFSPDMRFTLGLAACVGHSFDSTILAGITGVSERSMARQLAQFENAGMIEWRGEDYIFVHDRIQQAAATTIAEGDVPSVHARIGRHLRGPLGSTVPEESLFSVVRHLNEALSQIDDLRERLDLALLNAAAAKKAADSAAWQAALDYSNRSIALLGDGGWQEHHEVLFRLYETVVECQFAARDFDNAAANAILLQSQARSPMQIARAVSWRRSVLEVEGRIIEAVGLCLDSLSKLGAPFPAEEDAESRLREETQLIEMLRAGRPIESLLDLPAVEDERVMAIMYLFNISFVPIAATGSFTRQLMVGALMLRYSLQYGLCGEAAFGIGEFGTGWALNQNDFAAGARYAALAVKVAERFGNPRHIAESSAVLASTLKPYVASWADCIAHARGVIVYNRRHLGETLWAAYVSLFNHWNYLCSGINLKEVSREASRNWDWLNDSGMTVFRDTVRIQINLTDALLGVPELDGTLDGRGVLSSRYDKGLQTPILGVIIGGDPAVHIAHYVASSLILHYLMERYSAAVQMRDAGLAAITPYAGTNVYVIISMFAALSLASLGVSDSSGFDEYQEFVRTASRSCPDNFLSWSLLLDAEALRLKGSPDAILLYEQALDEATRTANELNRALAYEAFARLWRDRKNALLERSCISEARKAFGAWGAKAKVSIIDRKYPEILQKQLEVASDLDSFTVIKAARAISGEMNVGNLLAELLKITIENAGARRGFFIREGEGIFQIIAGSHLGGENYQAQPLADLWNNLFTSVVHYTATTGQTVVLGNAASDPRFSKDPYAAFAPECSVLCQPINYRGKMQGVLYLDNDLTSEAFTIERVKVIEVLLAQAAISLENAELFEEVSKEVSRRRHAEQTLRLIVEGTASATGGEFFRLLVRHLADALEVRYSFVTEVVRDQHCVRTLAFWVGSQFTDNIVYETRPTPCHEVIEGRTVFIPDDVQQKFPADRDLAELCAKSYLGLPLNSASGSVIGHLAVLDDRPMQESEQRTALLRIFAARAAAELERVKASENLQSALSELESLKNRLHAENVYLQEEIRREHDFDEVIGNSPELISVLDSVGQVAATDSTVLIYGETGTGKELIARAIHERSHRQGRPLVKVNCGAISAGLVESELFGHVKGAFTGAIDKRIGRFELANGGTIFLDEIGELPVETQVKLLRVLQEQEFEPVGSSRTIRADVRVIAATNRNLKDEVIAGRFRADLYYRLNVFPIRVPPLRHRRADIPPLVMYFLQRFSRKMGRSVHSISQATMERLVAYHWPGNIRELQNVIERALVTSKKDILAIDEDMLPLRETPEPSQRDVPTTGMAPLEALEREHIMAALKRASWVIEGPKGAAAILNLHPNTLRSRLKKMNIQRPAPRPQAQSQAGM